MTDSNDVGLSRGTETATTFHNKRAFRVICLVIPKEVFDIIMFLVCIEYRNLF